MISCSSRWLKIVVAARQKSVPSNTKSRGVSLTELPFNGSDVHFRNFRRMSATARRWPSACVTAVRLAASPWWALTCLTRCIGICKLARRRKRSSRRTVRAAASSSRAWLDLPSPGLSWTFSATFLNVRRILHQIVSFSIFYAGRKVLVYFRIRAWGLLAQISSQRRSSLILD